MSRSRFYSEVSTSDQTEAPRSLRNDMEPSHIQRCRSLAPSCGIGECKATIGPSIFGFQYPGMPLAHAMMGDGINASNSTGRPVLVIQWLLGIRIHCCFILGGEPERRHRLASSSGEMGTKFNLGDRSPDSGTRRGQSNPGWRGAGLCELALASAGPSTEPR